MARKAMSTEKARQVRQQGHDDALEFARTIGVESDYRNNLKAKKDVIDGNGDTHSVKSGQKRWQIFLYRSSRLQSDDAFLSMNGVGQLLIDCLKVYPEKFTDYQKNTQAGDKITIEVERKDKKGNWKLKKLKAKAMKVKSTEKNVMKLKPEPTEREQKIYKAWLQL